MLIQQLKNNLTMSQFGLTPVQNPPYFLHVALVLRHVTDSTPFGNYIVCLHKTYCWDS